MYAKTVFALLIGWKAKIRKLKIVFRIKQNVFWFEVPMYYAGRIM